jgi:hypothetical protein
VVVGFEQARTLHGDQEYVFDGPPPRAGAMDDAAVPVNQ